MQLVDRQTLVQGAQAKHARRKGLMNTAADPSKPGIAKALAMASCVALNAVPLTAMGQGEAGTWDFEAATLYYSEADDRVMAVEPVFSATRNFEEGQTLNLKGVFDVLTGASPNGATPSDQAQTFTRPSGSSDYTVDASDAPLDDTFKDTRIALSATWAAPIDRDWDYSAGLYASNEYDYFSLGLNGSLTHYLNHKNTTLNMGVSLQNDWVDPVGGAPIGLTQMAHRSSPTFDADFSASRENSSDSKVVMDLLFGVSQVLDRNTIMQFNYGVSVSDGYLNDPYKLLSVIDDAPGANFGGNLKDLNGNNIYLYEQRPDSRTKHSFYWQVKHALKGGDVFDVSYRFMFDDWGVNSHTLETSYRWKMGQSYLEPYVRYYQQSEADFYRRYVTSSDYNSGSLTFDEATADYRLGDLTGITLGAKYGWRMDNGHEAKVRLSYYLQSNDGDQGFGALSAQELYPDTNALMLSFGYSF